MSAAMPHWCGRTNEGHGREVDILALYPTFKFSISKCAKTDPINIQARMFFIANLILLLLIPSIIAKVF
jgi:hypothetical protein